MPFTTSTPAPGCLLIQASGLLTQTDYRKGMREARSIADSGVHGFAVLADDVRVIGVDIGSDVLQTFAPAFARLRRLALVGEIAKYEEPLKWFGPPTTAEIKTFAAEELTAAVEWVCEG